MKDALWMSLTLAVSFTLLHAANSLKTFFLNKVFNSILFLIGEYADLSAEYGGEFILTIPRIPLFNYSILLKDDEYTVLVQGTLVLNGTWKYRFNSMSLEPGGTYAVRTSGNGFVLTRR